jgi:hypothetical protein
MALVAIGGAPSPLIPLGCIHENWSRLQLLYLIVPAQTQTQVLCDKGEERQRSIHIHIRLLLGSSYLHTYFAAFL